MSTTIDERVVEMRFDNKQFESNVSTSMSTLKKLKESLKFKGATKGLEEIDAASKRVNMSGLGGAVDSVKARFSALQVVGVTALANITNSAINAGKSIVKSLTIDPVKSGFNEYETKMGSIQTILANTEHQGTTLDDVTAALDKLNLYADKTIYNFQEMTRNIGTFTAAGVDLETSVRSIQGIANLAAVSGSTSQQASTAMYQLSQALATGTVKLQDWNSVVNAGMGGKVFQNALIQTAAVLDGAADDVAAWQAKNIDAFGSFRESLTRGEWLTSEVLTRTLEQFTMTAEEGSETWEEYKKSLMDTGYTEAQAESILKMANTASDAATKVKTFTQLMDTLKESAQSGWAQTWEIIIGDFEEAKAFFTELSDLFGGIIGKSADRRNNFLSEVFTSNWDKLISQINAAGVETERFEESIRKVAGDDELDGLIEKYGSLEEAVRSGAISSDILKKALDGIAETEADTKIAGFVDGLKEINRTLRRGHVGEDVKKLQIALDSLGYDLGAPGIDGVIGPITEKAIKAFQEANGLVANGIVGEETLAALEKAGTKVEELEGNVGDLKSTCKGLVDTITQKSGRELLLDSLMNVIKAIQRPLSAVGEAFRDIFSVSPEKLYNGLEKLNKFSKSLVMGGVLDATSWSSLIDGVKELGIDSTKFVTKLSEALEENGVNVDKLKEKYGSLAKAFDEGAISIDIITKTLLGFDGITESMLVGGETADKIRRSFAGLFAVLDMIAKVTGGVFKFAFDIATEILGRFGLGILDITASIGDFLVGINDALEGLVDVSKIVDFLMPHIEAFADTIGNWVSGLFNSLKNTEVFKQFESALGDLGDAFRKFRNGEIDIFDLGFYISDFAGKVLLAIPAVREWFNVFKESPRFQTWVDAFDELGKQVDAFRRGEIGLLDLAKAFGEYVSKVLMAIPIVEKWINAFNGWIESFKNLPAVKQFTDAINSISEAWNKLISGEINFSDFGTVLGENLAKAITAIPEIIKGVAKGFLSVGSEIASDFIAGFQNGIFSSVSNVISSIIGFCQNFVSSFASALGVQSPSWKAFEIAQDFIQGFINGLKAAIGKVISILKKIGEQIVKVFKGIWDFITDENGNIEWDKIFAGGAILGIVYVAKQIGTAMSGIAKAFGGIDDIIDSASVVLKNFGKVLNGVAWDFKAKALLKLAASIAILVGAIWVLAQIDDKGNLWNAVGVIFVLSAILVGLAFAMDRMSTASVQISKKGASIEGLKTSLLQISAALILLALTVKIIGNLDPEQAKQGFIGLAGVAVGLLVFLAVMGGISIYSKDVDKIGDMMLRISAAMILMVVAMKMISKMDPGDIVIGIAVLEAFVLFCVQLGVANRIAGSGGKNFGGNVITIAASMLILSMAMKTIAKLDPDDIITGIATLQAFVILIGEMAVINRLAGSDESKFGGAVMSMSMSIMILTGVIWMLSKMNESDVDKGIKVMQKFVLLIAELTLISKLAGKDVANVSANILAMSVAIGILAGIAVLLSFIDVKSLAKGIVAVGMLGTIMTLMIWATRGTQDVKGNLIAMTVAIGIMAGAVVALSFIDGKKLAGAVLAMDSLMLAFAVMIKVANSCSGANGIVKNMAAMLGVVLALAGIVAVLSYIPNPESALKNAVALSALMIALSSSLLIASKAGEVSGNTVKQLGALTLVVAGLAGILAALSFLPNAETMIPNAIALGILLNALSASLVVLKFAGNVASESVKSAMLMGIVLAEIAVVLKLMSVMDVTPSVETSLALSVLLLALSAACLIVSKVPSAAAIDGALGLAAFIGVMAAVVTALGLLTKIPGFSETIADGGKTLGLIGTAIGNFVGGIVGGIAAGIGSAIISLLPELGLALSAFMVGAQPFISLASSVNSSVVAGAGYMTAAILVLTAAGFISGVANILTLGQSSFSALGEELMAFGTGAKNFFDTINGVDSGAVEAATNVTNMILALTASEFISGIAKLFGGDVDFASLGTKLNAFGEAVVGFSGTISGKVDVGAVEAATRAGELLVALNKSLPRSGGLVQDIIGEKDLEKFSTSVAAFAACIININNVISQEGFEIQSEKLAQMADAGTKFSELNNALPRSGGLAQDFAGEQDLATFSSGVAAFASCIIRINEVLSQEGLAIQSDKLTKLAQAGTNFSELNNSLPRSGGVAQDLAGEQDLVRFSTGVAAFAACMVSVNASISQEGFSISLEGMEQLKQAGLKMNELQEVLPKTGGWWQEIAGESDIGDFGTKVETFATAIKTTSTVASEIEFSTIDSLITATYRMKALIESLSGIDVSGVMAFTGVGGGWPGADGPAYDIAKAIAKFCSETADVDASKLSSTITSANRIKTLISSLVGLDTSGIENFKPQEIGSAMKDYGSKVGGINAEVVSSSITSANRLKIFISSLSSLDSSGVSNFKITALGTSLKDYGKSVSSTSFEKVAQSITVASQLRNFISSLSGLDTSSVSLFKTAITELGTINAEAVATSLNALSSQMTSTGSNMIIALANGVRSKSSYLVSAIKAVLTKLISTINSKKSSFTNAGKSMASAFASGIRSGSSSASSAASSMASSASSSANKSSAFYSSGAACAKGFAQGITDNAYLAVNAAGNMAQDAVDKANEILNVNSPSKVFMKTGASVVEGFTTGIERGTPIAAGASKLMAESVIDQARTVLSGLDNLVSDSLVSQPTIRPVVDLSDVKTGAAAVSGIFGRAQTVGVNSNLNAVNVAMNRKLQNGTNDDVISAIDRLASGLENNRGDTYNFGDFTYDDGSEVAEAVGTLIRYAKIGRRV